MKEPYVSFEPDFIGSKRRGRWLVPWIAAALSLAMAVPAVGITDGTVDSNDEFPFVAIAILFFPDGSAVFCSAGQIDELHLITAAHCFQPAIPPEEGGPPNLPVPGIQVRWGPNALAPDEVRTGTWFPDEWVPFAGPGLPGFDNADIAVIKLDQPHDPVSSSHSPRRDSATRSRTRPMSCWRATEYTASSQAEAPWPTTPCLMVFDGSHRPI